ncbi:MAG: 30S ribosomal protein S11 [Patescibacteria group bacterium]
MGKKRIIRKAGGTVDAGLKSRSLAKGIRNKVTTAILVVQATFNNTKVSLTDGSGNVLAWSSSGALGFAGAKKGTPFAAAKVGELLGERAQLAGVTEASVVIRGIGSGREAAVRSFAQKGITITRIADETPFPHNGVKAPKPRRI